MNKVAVEKRAIDWIVGPDTGISSETIWAVMMGAKITNHFCPACPQDPDDFGRCYRLLKLIPEWRRRLSEVVQHYPKWRFLVQEWARLQRMYVVVVEDGKNTYASWRAMYDVMQQIRRAR